jgi:hypothetical protein
MAQMWIPITITASQARHLRGALQRHPHAQHSLLRPSQIPLHPHNTHQSPPPPPFLFSSPARSARTCPRATHGSISSCTTFPNPSHLRSGSPELQPLPPQPPVGRNGASSPPGAPLQTPRLLACLVCLVFPHHASPIRIAATEEATLLSLLVRLLPIPILGFP